MPGLKQMPTAPQPANIDLNLPAQLPQIPDDVIERFPSLQQYQEQWNQWWDAVTTILNDLQSNNASVLNNNVSDVATLQTEVADLQPGDYEAGVVASTGVVPGTDGAGNPVKYLVAT